MRIVFYDADNNHYALHPACENRGNQRFITFSHVGCTGYLLFRAPLDQPIDLRSDQLRHALAELEDRFLYITEEKLSRMEQFSVRYVSHTDLFRNKSGIEIPEGAANYAVCGVWKQGDELRILIPAKAMTYTTAVAMELHYSIKPHRKAVKKFFRTVFEETTFYQVTFERKPGYVNGTVFYTIGSSGIRYPVVEKMIGATTLINTYGQVPEFRSVAPGVKLIKNEGGR